MNERQQLTGFEARLEAELARVVVQRASAVRPASHGRRQAVQPYPQGPPGWQRPEGPPGWQRQPGMTERLAGRLLRSPGLARALVTTPSLLLGWVVATVVVLAAGLAATLGTHTPYVPLFAPGIAAAGIAYAYGPGIDPAWELTQSMAVSDRMILLARSLAVFSLNAALGLAASAASGAAAAVTFGWLVPMTAVCMLALAAATVARSANVGVAAGLGSWAITVLAGKAAGGQLTAAVSHPALIPGYLAVAVICAAVALRATRIPRGT